MTGVAAAADWAWAEIIAVGSELLVPPRVDTNSIFISDALNAIGIQVRAKAIVGDRRGDLAAVFREALARTPLVILCGGLGPTDDDLTRDAVADVLGLPLEEHAGVLERIRQRFAHRARPMPDVNRRQALVPRGAVVIPNEQGTAPGLWIERAQQIVILLPGPPGELKPMFSRIAEDRLAVLAGAERVYRRTLRLCGRTESEVEQVAFPIYSAWMTGPVPIETTVLTAPAQIELHLTVRSASEPAAAARLDAAVAQLRVELGDDVFSVDGRPLEVVVGEGLRRKGWRVAAAESCTGGLLSSRLTDVPGSSDYVVANAVCYSNESKTSWLGVPPATIADHGAVSEPVAMAMAEGIRRRTGVEIGVGVTGIAGPTGGSESKPVGTVAVAVVTADARVVRTYRFPGGRLRVKQFASQMALDMIRRVVDGCEVSGAFVVRPSQELRG